MYIKGQPVAELFTIKDTTPGRTVIFIIFIMVLVFIILYELLSIYWDDRKIEKLYDLKHQFERELRGQKESTRKNAIPVDKKGKASTQQVLEDKNTDMENKSGIKITDAEEALKLLNELRN